MQPAPGEAPSTIAPAAERSWIARHAQWLLCAVPVLVVVGLAWQWRWMCDDGFIHLRVVQQIVHGNGPVFNVGERVEASTSPLWVGVLTLAHPITSLDLPWKAVLLGVAFTGLGVAAAQRAAIEAAHAAGHAGLVLPLGAVVVAGLPPFWEFATSGLETGVAFGWLGLSCWWTTHRAVVAGAGGTGVSRRAEVAGAALVGLGWLIRPDLAVFSVAFGAVLVAVVWSGGWRRRLAVVGAMAALPGLYQVFRMGYYGLLVPNTALAKEAGTAQWGRGWRYLIDLAGPYWLWLPVVVLLAVVARQVMCDLDTGARLRAMARLAPATAGVVHAAYVVRFGGDFMHARLLLPALFAVVAPVGLPLPRRDDILRVGVAVAVGGWAVVSAVWLRPDLWSSETLMGGRLPINESGTIEQERELFRVLTGMRHPVRQELLEVTVDPSSAWYTPGVATVVELEQLLAHQPIQVPLRRDLDVDGAFSSSAIGTISYRRGPAVHTVDIQSLAHPVGSHLDVWESTYKPGHQKPVPLVWMVAAVSDVDRVHTSDGEVVVTASELDDARAALECGQLADYLDGIQEPLTPGRFAGNVLDSVANTFLQVSPDPDDARRQLCRR